MNYVKEHSTTGINKQRLVEALGKEFAYKYNESKILGDIFLFDEGSEWNKSLQEILPSNCNLTTANSTAFFMEKIFDKKFDLFLLVIDLKNKSHCNFGTIITSQFHFTPLIIITETHINTNILSNNPWLTFSWVVFYSGRTQKNNIKSKIDAFSNRTNVFISYSRKDQETKQIVEKLERNIKRKIYPLNIKRDIRDLKFRDNLFSYMDLMIQGQYVIPIISDAYLKSKYCMYELVNLYQNFDFKDKIYPIITTNADIYSIQGRRNYQLFWKKEIEPFKNADFHDPEIELLRNIHDFFPDIVDILKSMFTITPETLASSDYQELINALTENLEKDGYVLWK